ncbi:T3SS effector HopA1 family protein [Actinokineospora sp. UTMC 2448]|uniref:T3SS effector HopA1 family protein n=1 Tax=Actinokineospora sp. UTMC 2448 TaxID=2268449 RepID=UPI002164C433|nr:T3SS effector HopA1 family protein [Actinokineospora sp. UTMC 2448]UVS81380.1 hypothetical protein Actkin_05137 [Actinokineospora sp. UTMC 2448]
MNQHTGLAARLTDAVSAVSVDLPTLTAQIGVRSVNAPTERALAARLGVVLYDELHRGGQAARTLPRVSPLEGELGAAVPHRHTMARVRVLDPRTVSMAGVVVRLPDDSRLDVGTTVIPLPAARPRLSPGYFLVDGSLGAALGGSQVLRMYLHVDGESRVDTWARVLRLLESLAVPYRAKVASAGPPRRDGMVVYLGPAAFGRVADFLDAAVDLPGLTDPTSVFARRIGPGVALAWEPDDRRPGRRDGSFGQHRGAALADGLIAHARTGAPDAVAAALRAANIDPAAPERNLSSPTDFPSEPAGGSTTEERTPL